MNEQPHDLDYTLLSYFDNTLSEEAKKKFEIELQNNVSLQEKLKSLKRAENLMQGLKPEEPSRNFTHLVMGKINQAPMARASFRNSFFLLIGIVFTIIVSAVLVSSGVFDSTATFDLNGLITSNEFIKYTLPTITISVKFIVNIIIILNLALAFVVFDKTILKPFFENRARIL